MKLVPKPDISYILDADPVQTRKRKPEYPLDFLHINRASYIALSDLIGGITVIPPMPIRDVEQRVINPVQELLSAERPPIEQAVRLAD